MIFLVVALSAFSGAFLAFHRCLGIPDKTITVLLGVDQETIVDGFDVYAGGVDGRAELIAGIVLLLDSEWAIFFRLWPCLIEADRMEQGHGF